MEQQPLCKNKIKLPKWIWQQANEVTLGKTNSCKNTHLAKHTLVKTQTCKGSKKLMNKWWTFKPNTLFLLWKKKDNEHNVKFIRDKWPNLNSKPNLKPNPKPFLLCIDFK